MGVFEVRGVEVTVEDAKEKLREEGYVVLREKSYRQAQEKRRIAEARLAWSEEQVAGTREWARTAFEEQRRLADRLVFVYGVARAHGASVDELRGDL